MFDGDLITHPDWLASAILRVRNQPWLGPFGHWKLFGALD